MTVEKIGLVNSLVPKQVGFGSESSPEKQQTNPSDNNGAKFFTVAAGIAAIALAGIALRQGSKIKKLNKLVEEGKKLLPEGTKSVESVQKAADVGKVSENVCLKNEAPKPAERTLAAEGKAYIQAIKVEEAKDLVSKVEKIKKNSKGKAHNLKEQAITKTFDDAENAIKRDLKWAADKINTALYSEHAKAFDKQIKSLARKTSTNVHNIKQEGLEKAFGVTKKTGKKVAPKSLKNNTTAAKQAKPGKIVHGTKTVKAWSERAVDFINNLFGPKISKKPASKRMIAKAEASATEVRNFYEEHNPSI